MSTQKTLTALLAGAAIGAVAGIMFAPASGDKTRKKVMKKASDLRNQLTDMMGQGGAIMNDAKETAKKASDQASKVVNNTMDEAKSSFERAKNGSVKA